jgi:single-strand DNA-binding protein
MNEVIITGNLGADPEIRYSQNRDPIATFNLAFRHGKDKTGWIKVVCFNKTAEVAETYLHKRATILISATLDYNKWDLTIPRRLYVNLCKRVLDAKLWLRPCKSYRAC